MREKIKILPGCMFVDGSFENSNRIWEVVIPELSEEPDRVFIDRYIYI